jgi:hypothetical protein
MSTLLQDLRIALRTLVRSPGFAMTTGLVLAHSIEVNSMIAGGIGAILLRFR